MFLYLQLLSLVDSDFWLYSGILQIGFRGLNWANFGEDNLMSWYTKYTLDRLENIMKNIWEDS